MSNGAAEQGAIISVGQMFRFVVKAPDPKAFGGRTPYASRGSGAPEPRASVWSAWSLLPLLSSAPLKATDGFNRNRLTLKWTDARRPASTVAMKFRYRAVVRIPSPPLEERARERRPFVSKFLCQSTSFSS